MRQGDEAVTCPDCRRDPVLHRLTPCHVHNAVETNNPDTSSASNYVECEDCINAMEICPRCIQEWQIHGKLDTVSLLE